MTNSISSYAATAERVHEGEGYDFVTNVQVLVPDQAKAFPAAG
jgi:hypothetical protein